MEQKGSMLKRNNLGDHVHMYVSVGSIVIEHIRTPPIETGHMLLSNSSSTRLKSEFTIFVSCCDLVLEESENQES